MKESIQGTSCADDKPCPCALSSINSLEHGMSNLIWGSYACIKKVNKLITNSNMLLAIY